MAELFATTGDSVAHIIKRGDTWNAELTLKDSGAQCLALDPRHPGTLYVGTRGKGFGRAATTARPGRIGSCRKRMSSQLPSVQ